MFSHSAHSTVWQRATLSIWLHSLEQVVEGVYLCLVAKAQGLLKVDDGRVADVDIILARNLQSGTTNIQWRKAAACKDIM